MGYGLWIPYGLWIELNYRSVLIRTYSSLGLIMSASELQCARSNIWPGLVWSGLSARQPVSLSGTWRLKQSKGSQSCHQSAQRACLVHAGLCDFLWSLLTWSWHVLCTTKCKAELEVSLILMGDESVPLPNPAGRMAGSRSLGKVASSWISIKDFGTPADVETG